MFTYRQTYSIGLPARSVAATLFFTLCARSKTVQTYSSRTLHCDAARALLGEQYGAAFLTSASNRSYRHTMTALITSLYSHHLGSPQWCPFRTRSLSLRCPFKRGTKTAVSAPDLLTLNLVLCARASSTRDAMAGSLLTIGLVSRMDLNSGAKAWSKEFGRKINILFFCTLIWLTNVPVSIEMILMVTVRFSYHIVL